MSRTGTSTPPMVRGAIVSACTELVERRAADLDDADREALRWLRDRIGVNAQFPMFSLQGYENRAALAALDKLLGESKP